MWNNKRKVKRGTRENMREVRKGVKILEKKKRDGCGKRVSTRKWRAFLARTLATKEEATVTHQLLPHKRDRGSNRKLHRAKQSLAFKPD